jgi:hypothetical protein
MEHFLFLQNYFHFIFEKLLLYFFCPDYPADLLSFTTQFFFVQNDERIRKAFPRIPIIKRTFVVSFKNPSYAKASEGEGGE